MTYARWHRGDALRGEVTTDRATAALDNVARRLWRARGEGPPRRRRVKESDTWYPAGPAVEAGIDPGR